MTATRATEAAIKRAIKAAKAAGMAVARCEIMSDGRIVLSSLPDAPNMHKPPDPFDLVDMSR